MTSGVYKHKKTQGFRKGDKNPMFGRVGDKNPATRSEVRKKLSVAAQKRYSSGEKLGFQIGQTDEKCSNWKGDDAGCGAMHRWVERQKGKVSVYKCVDCDEYAHHLSNKDHSYSRKLEDYSPRCSRCHKLYDKNKKKGFNKNLNKTKKDC